MDRIATGHFDCAHEMIYDGDTVVTPDGTARVSWDGTAWLLEFSDHIEPMNRYGGKDIRASRQ